MATLELSILRILDAQGETVGAGFVVSENLVVTCAHVVDDAGCAPGGAIRFVFHATGEEWQAQVDTVLWRPADQEDVAFLRLEGDLPEGIQPVLLGASEGTDGHPFTTLGFPDANPQGGVYGDGHILGETRLGAEGIKVLQLSSPQVTPGFSGAPVYDTTSERVIGMVTAIADPDRHGRLGETAFITPTETLRAICPQLQLSDICPYRGLVAFTEADARFFHGRQDLIDRLVKSLKRQPRFLAVLGPSGSGKSSLVQAGLVPALRKGAIPGSEGWKILVTRPGAEPFHQLAGLGLQGAEQDLVEAVKGWLRDRSTVPQLLLVLDQFEELLMDCPQEVQERFVAGLVGLLDAPLPVVVIPVLRDDFYPRFTRQADKLLPWVDSGGLFNIPTELTEQDLSEIIRKPAESVGLQFAAGLVADIIQDVQQASPTRSGRSAVLPLLEFTLTQLWERRQEGMLTHENYQAIGGVAGGLAQWADHTYYALGQSERGLAQRILIDLVHLGDESRDLPDSRRRRSVVELIPSPGEEEATLKVIKGLADARLLVTGSDGETVEIIHEALLREWMQLQGWIRADRRFLAWRQELEPRIESWRMCGEEEGALLHGLLLAEAENWLQQRGADLDEEERIYIQHSTDLREQAARDREARNKARMISLGGISVLAVLFTTAFVAWMLTAYQFNPYLYVFGRQVVEDENPFIELEGGEMVFGSDLDEREPAESPIESYVIPTFYMQQTEVTNHQYRICRQAGGCSSDPVIRSLYEQEDKKNHPVVYITAFQAMEFCQWLGGDLPTSQQWERAARGLDGRPWPWGDSPITPTRTNTPIDGVYPDGTVEVGSFPAGAAIEKDTPILNLVGNVAEWILEKEKGFAGDIDMASILIRGGSYTWEINRITVVQPLPISQFADSLGFRCVTRNR